MKWLKSLLLAAFAGGIVAAAAIAPSMVMDGFSAGEWRVMSAYFVNGALGGLAGLFVNKPQKRDSAED